MAKALKPDFAEGNQKLASVRCGLSLRKAAHSLSVTPTTAFMSGPYAGTLHRSTLLICGFGRPALVKAHRSPGAGAVGHTTEGPSAMRSDPQS